MGTLTNSVIKKRKYISIIICFLFCIVTAACSAQKTEDTQPVEKSAKQETVENTKEGTIPKDLLPGSAEEALDGSAVPSGSASDSSSNESGQAEAQGGSGTQGADEISGAGGGSTQSGQQSAGKSTMTVQLTVESSQAEAYGYSVNYAVTMELKKGATVYEALKQSGIESSGSGYIESIGGLPEKAAGAMSGWKYYVNGKEPGVGAKDYVLQNGDQVQWSYVLKP